MYMCMSLSPVCLNRQKQSIAKLQTDVREGEAKLRQMLVAKAREQGGTGLEARLQVLWSWDGIYMYAW